MGWVSVRGALAAKVGERYSRPGCWELLLTKMDRLISLRHHADCVIHIYLKAGKIGVHQWSGTDGMYLIQTTSVQPFGCGSGRIIV